MARDPDATQGDRSTYRWYVLCLFTLVYAFNFIDRQIVVILAPYLKTDLHLSDAQVGVLYGTGFALFYALFGLPLARLADGWHRVRLLSFGLAAWSAMTALSGAAGSFAQLALARVGVGIGEASGSPAAFSIIQDYFPKRRRATALAIYSSGIYLGIGASLGIGGKVVGWWLARYPGGTAPLGLAAWQAAYLAVGLPGLVLAIVVLLSVREPIRGGVDGRAHPGDPHPFRDALGGLATLLPGVATLALCRFGAPPRLARRSVVVLAVAVAVVAAMIASTDGLLDPAHRAAVATIGGIEITTNAIQWSAIGIGAYATWSWIQSLRLRDAQAAALTIGSPSFVALAIGGGLLSFSSYGIAAFMFVYGKAELGLVAADGVELGAIAAVAGGLGTLLGGILADAAWRRHPGGRLFVASAAAAISAGLSLWQYETASPTQFYAAYFLATLCLTMWLGPVFATAQDHVPPRMRGTATAVQFLGINLIGLGLGPYWVGLVSDTSGDLRLAILSALLPLPAAIALFLFAARRVAAAEAAPAAA